jgi:hypothetical protein
MKPIVFAICLIAGAVGVSDESCTETVQSTLDDPRSNWTARSRV